MCGKVSCLGGSQLHFTIYTHTISGFHSLSQQDNLCSGDSLATTLADALGFYWDCHYVPRLARAGNRDKSVGHGLLDYSIEMR